jgi:hypothetical protein
MGIDQVLTKRYLAGCSQLPAITVQTPDEPDYSNTSGVDRLESKSVANCVRVIILFTAILGRRIRFPVPVSCPPRSDLIPVVRAGQRDSVR